MPKQMHKLSCHQQEIYMWTPMQNGGQQSEAIKAHIPLKLIPFKWARHQLDSILFFVYAQASSLETMKFGKTLPVQQNMTKPMIKFETASARMEALQLEVSCLSKFRIDNYEGQRCQLKK